MSNIEEDLKNCRKEIDAIDDEIIELLGKRMKIVSQVGKIKHASGIKGSFIRSGREASMIRELVAKSPDVFSANAITTIWRIIISTSLNLEQKMVIAAFAPESDKTCYWLAREYYGAFLEIKIFDNIEDIIKGVEAGDFSVGILPFVNQNWWLRPKSERNDIHVFAKIPFLKEKNPPFEPALAIANVVPEQTEDDISVLSVSSDLNEEEIKRIFAQNKITTNIINQHHNHYLIEADKYIKSDCRELVNIRENLSGDIRLLGSYAKQI